MGEAAGLPPVPLPIPLTDHDPTLAAAVAGEKRKRELELPPPQIAKKKAPLNTNNVMIQELGTGAGSKWNSAEDAALRKGVEEIGTKNWKRVAQEYLQGERTHIQCLHRWQKVLQPGLRKGFWTEEEDTMIRQCIMEGNTKWSSIAAKIPGRIGKQIRERWYNHLDPTIKKGGWDEEEDAVLLEVHEKLGNQWREIAKHLPGRTENSVKNRWHSAKLALQRHKKEEVRLAAAQAAAEAAMQAAAANAPPQLAAQAAAEAAAAAMVGNPPPPLAAAPAPQLAAAPEIEKHLPGDPSLHPPAPQP